MWRFMKHGDGCTLHEVFSYQWVVYSASCCMKNRNWHYNKNNLIVHRHVCPSDAVWDPSEIGLRKNMRKVTVLPAVVHCSWVERYHYRWAYCLYLLHWWKQMFLWKFGACLPDCTDSQEDSNAEENITSFKLQEEDPLHDNMFFKRDLNQGVYHVKFQYFTLCSAWKAYSYRGQCRSL